LSALYDRIGTTYSRYRRPDPRIAAAIDAALYSSGSVISVGAGPGSYEPRGPRVVGVEPSRTMIEQRANDAAPVAQGVAEHLPFPDQSFDAALAVLTVHHWPDAASGLKEMQRVALRQVVMTWDPAVVANYWLIADYLPELAEQEAPLVTAHAIARMLDTNDVRVVPVPRDCSDGFMAAYWRRPERYLDPDARAAISGLSLLNPQIVTRAMHALRADLASGAWRQRHADLLALDEFDAGYRLVVAG
jgi:SAM-dependent methyltransferase